MIQPGIKEWQRSKIHFAYHTPLNVGLTAEFAASDVVVWALAAQPGHVAVIDELGCIERGADAHSVIWTGRAREPEPLQLGDALLRIQEGLALLL